MIWAQQPAPVGQADPVTSKVTMWWSATSRSTRQSASWSVPTAAASAHPGQSLRDLQPGDRAQAMPQQAEVDHLGQGLTVSRWVPGHVRSFWRRLGSATPPRGGSTSQPCGSVSLPADTAMQQPLPAVLVEVVVAVADTLCLTLNRESRCDSGSTAVHHTGIKLLP